MTKLTLKSDVLKSMISELRMDYEESLEDSEFIFEKENEEHNIKRGTYFHNVDFKQLTKAMVEENLPEIFYNSDIEKIQIGTGTEKARKLEEIKKQLLNELFDTAWIEFEKTK